MSWRDAMRRALAVDGSRDGVPMLLALSDERPDAPSPATSADGVRVAGLLDGCRDELAPSARDADLGIVITVLATVASEELG